MQLTRSMLEELEKKETVMVDGKQATVKVEKGQVTFGFLNGFTNFVDCNRIEPAVLNIDIQYPN